MKKLKALLAIIFLCSVAALGCLPPTVVGNQVSAQESQVCPPVVFNDLPGGKKEIWVVQCMPDNITYDQPVSLVVHNNNLGENLVVWSGGLANTILNNQGKEFPQGKIVIIK